MRLNFILNKEAPESKLADVEIQFEEGLLAGMKLIGCSVWKAKKNENPTVLVPSRSYATAGGVRYYELLRDSDDGNDGSKRFRDFVREEYLKVAK